MNNIPTKNNDDSTLAKWEEIKEKPIPIQEIILDIFKAGLSSLPFTGAIASLMTDFIPSSRTQRIEQFAELIAGDLARLQERVNSDYILTDDFAFMFEKCFRAAAENYQTDKLEALRGILINSVIRRDVTEGEKEYFLNLTQSLTTTHIRILRFMATPEDYLNATGIPQERIRGSFNQFFPFALPGLALDVIKSAFGDLYRYGFLNTDVSIFHTMTAGQGLELLRGRVNEFGQRFILFCSVP